jgi:hypothetical protein
MRKTVKLPAPELSQLKEVNIDLDMTGRHYAQLATSEGQVPEDVAISILKDLVEEDAGKLTMAEVRYLFMLVKINSLENNYEATVSCTHEKKDGTVCGCLNTVKIRLSDADLNPTPKHYKVPELEFCTEDSEKTYLVMPPTADMESALWNWFLTVKNKKIDDLAEDKQTSTEYTFLRGCLHLVDKKSGERLIQEFNDFEQALKLLDCNKFSTIHKLYELVVEVSQFGVQNKIYETTCKECGGKLIFRLPLLNGLSD